MEVLIVLVLIGLVVMLAPYILAGVMMLSGIVAVIVLGFFALIKKLLGR